MLTREDLPLSIKPGNAIRLALMGFPDGSGRRSGTWRIFTGKNAPDIYIAARSLTGSEKVSLHASGHNKYGFINSDRAEEVLGPSYSSRHLDEWDRPSEFAKGWVHEFRIYIPHDELAHWPPSVVEKGPIYGIPPVGEGLTCQLEVFRVRSPAAKVDFDDALHIADMRLSDGSVARIIGIKSVIPVERYSALTSTIAEAIVDADPETIRKADVPRLSVRGHTESRSRFVYELSLPGFNDSDSFASVQ